MNSGTEPKMLSEHFSATEFACKCGCGFDAVNPELVTLLEEVRTHFNAPVIIDSACRCEKHNRDIGGKPHSQHLLGTAADIKVKGYTPALVADWLEYRHPDSHGIGRYRTFTHIDVRRDRARWRG